LGARPG